MASYTLISFVTPSFTNDDPTVKYAGTIKVRAPSIAKNDSRLFDIYIANDCYVVRFGNESADYIALEGIEPRPLTAIVVEVAKLDRTPQKWTRQLILERMERSDAWITRGLVAIYNCQTESEQHSGVTNDDNGIGFSGAHSEFGSILAKQFIKRKSLSSKQMIYARKIALKYAGQLAIIANGRST